MSAKSIQHAIEYGAVRGALAAAGILPIPAGHALGAAFGSIAFDVLRVRRRVSVDNITRALNVPPREATAIARRAYRNFGKSLMEFAATPHLSWEDRQARIVIDGIEHLKAAHARGRGVVFVTAHQGNWEWMGASFVSLQLPVDFLVGEQQNARVDEVINGLRRGMGVGIIHRNVALRGVLRSLREGRVVALLADQDARRNGIMVDFLGRPASTVKGPALFAIRSGCPIVTGFVHRVGSRHRAVINPPIDPPDLPEDEAVRVLTQAHANALSEAIRAHPDEYFWPHRRWKTQSV